MSVNPYKTPESKLEGKPGYSFSFDHNGGCIECWGSNFSGKEWVSFNGEIVSERRTHGKTSEHQFQVSGIDYIVKFTVKSIFTGELICSLYADESLVKSYRAKPQSKFSIFSFLFICIIFFAYVALEYYLELPGWLFYVLVFITIILSGLFAKRNIEITEL